MAANVHVLRPKAELSNEFTLLISLSSSSVSVITLMISDEACDGAPLVQNLRQRPQQGPQRGPACFAEARVAVALRRPPDGDGCAQQLTALVCQSQAPQPRVVRVQVGLDPTGRFERPQVAGERRPFLAQQFRQGADRFRTLAQQT